jgi:predicted DNA-binding transcriptional regulator YafY
MLRRFDPVYGQQTTYSKRQLLRDIISMRAKTDAPIMSKRLEGNVWYHWYTDPNWSLPVPAFQNQLERLSESIVILDEFDGLPHGRELAQLRLNLKDPKNWREEANDPVLIFKSLPKGAGKENLEPLYEAISGAITVQIVYEKYNSKEQRLWTVHPYSLIEYARHWYLYCYNEEKKDHSVFSLDRIKSITASVTKYRYNDIPANIYFRDIIGVTRLRQEEVQDIELLVSPKLAPYFLARHMHHSQEEIGRHTDGTLHISLRLRINPELIDKLLGYGSEVRVLKSERLIARMREEVKKLMDLYDNSEAKKGRVMELPRVRKSGS